MNRKILILALLFTAGSFAGCKKASSSYTPDCSGKAKSYKTDVAPIMQTTCIGCHYFGSGIVDLSTYATVFSSRSSIRDDVASGKMPQTGTLTDSQKNNILCWIDSGAANN